MMSGDGNVVPCRGTAYEKALAERCFGGFQKRKGHCGSRRAWRSQIITLWMTVRVSLHPLKRNRKSWPTSKRRTFQLFWAVVYK